MFAARRVQILSMEKLQTQSKAFSSEKNEVSISEGCCAGVSFAGHQLSEERNQADHLKPKGYSAPPAFWVSSSCILERQGQLPCSLLWRRARTRGKIIKSFFSTCMTEPNLITSAPRRAGWSLYMNHAI